MAKQAYFVEFALKTETFERIKRSGRNEFYRIQEIAIGAADVAVMFYPVSADMLKLLAEVYQEQQKR